MAQFKIKVKKSYTYKEVCSIRDKVIAWSVKEYFKFIAEHNKYMITFCREWAKKNSLFRKEE
jgi:hypothetical protein